MKTIFVVTEGQSETNFVNKVLLPYFAGRCVLIPNTVVTSTDRRHGTMHKGGMTNYAQARNTLCKALAIAAKNKDYFVTTMFDWYRLPTDTPGMKGVGKLSDPYEKVRMVEEEIRTFEKVDSNLFLPYIQLHEFESMIFSDLSKLEEKYFEYDISPLKECVKQQSNPELINNGADTAPSKRILNCIENFDRANVGVDVLSQIGVEAISEKCQHFAEWIKAMEEKMCL